MARARNIKPSFFQNEELGELDPLARLLFIGMWTLADFKGCLEYRPKRLKVQLLPYDNCDIEALAKNLERSGFISIYSVQGQSYVKVINFEKHQNPHKNERDSGTSHPDISSRDDEIDEKSNENSDIEKIEKNREEDGTAPADSLLLIPESLNPITDSGFIDSPAEPDPPAAKKRVELDYSSWPEMPSKQVMNDWQSTRKKKRAVISQIVIDDFGKELHRAYDAGFTVDQCLTACVVHNWQGFKLEWLQNKLGVNHHAPNTPNRGKTWAERRDDLTDAVTNYERATNF